MKSIKQALDLLYLHCDKSCKNRAIDLLGDCIRQDCPLWTLRNDSDSKIKPDVSLSAEKSLNLVMGSERGWAGKLIQRTKLKF